MEQENLLKKEIANFKNIYLKILNEIQKDIIGQTDTVENVLIAMIAGGNILLEGVPGVGKTRLVKTIARVFNLPFSRIQFTPDLMPADVVGTNIIIKDKTGESKFQFNKGPIFKNIILADEINRTTPKTQSALLEAMQEKQITVMGETYHLDDPFFVLATQNPIEQEGTYSLPEAQLDRFMFKIIVLEPSLKELMEIVKLTQKTMLEVSEPVCDKKSLLNMRKLANQILVTQTLFEYAMTLCMATSPKNKEAADASKKYLNFGSSPRAGQALITACKVRALLKGRYNISFEDIEILAFPVLRHRIKLNFTAISEGINADDIISMIIKEINKRLKIR